MTDTHTHLYFPDYGDEIHGLIQKAMENGVSRFILPNVNVETISQMKWIHDLYPTVTSMAMGLHPSDVKENWSEELDIMEKEVESGNYIAMGEIGMDLYWDQTFVKEQKEAFKRQLRLAEKYRLPVIIHSRNALEETIEVITKVKPTVPLVFHSFTGKKEDVERIREVCDPYFGINGVVTYKNAPELREALPVIGLERIVLETDAPFLTPVPHRGKRNDSSYLIHIRDKVAETLGVKPEEVEAATDRQAALIFPVYTS